MSTKKIVKRYLPRYKKVRKKLNQSNIVRISMRRCYCNTYTQTEYKLKVQNFLEDNIGQHIGILFDKVKKSSTSKFKFWSTLEDRLLNIYCDLDPKYCLVNYILEHKTKMRRGRANFISLLEFLQLIDIDTRYRIYIKLLNTDVDCRDLEIVNIKTARLKLPKEYQKLYKREYFEINNRGEFIGINSTIQPALNLKTTLKECILWNYSKLFRRAFMVYNVTQNRNVIIEFDRRLFRGYIEIREDENYCEYLTLADSYKYIHNGKLTMPYIEAITKSLLDRRKIPKEKYTNIFKYLSK